MATKLLYHFNDDLTDSSGNSKTLSSVGSLSYLSGKFSKGLANFKDGSGYAYLNNAIDLGSSNFTAEIWTKFSDAGGSQQQGLFTIVNPSTGDSPISVYMYRPNQNTGELKMDAFGQQVSVSVNHLIADGQFYHVAVVRNGSSVYLYLHGSLSATASISGGSAFSNNEKLLIGQLNTGNFGNFAWNGVVDEFRLSDTALYSGNNFSVPTDAFSASQQGGLMAQQLKKKFLAPDSVDGSKIKLLSGESIRVVSGGSVVDLIKLDGNGKVQVGSSNQEVAIKSDVDTALALKADSTAVTSAISTAISNLINGAPSVLDTLNELAAALGNDANYATTITNALALKASITQLRAQGGIQAIASSGGSSSIDISTGARFTVITGSSAHTMVLPLLSSTEAGESFHFVNRSSGAVSINHNASDNSGSQVTSLSSNHMFVVRSNASKTSWVGVKVPVLTSSNELSLASQKIINLATPTADYDASTKKYVDDSVNAVKNTQIAHIETIFGVDVDANTHLGTFTGSTIPDSSDVKSALQALETALESAGVGAISADLGRVESILGVDIQTASHLGSFSGSTISSNTDVKSALQELETAVEAKISSSAIGAANGVAPLDANSKVDSSYLPSSIVGALKYKGTLDASGGSFPASPAQGDYYVISVAGTISGNYFHQGDWAVYNGSSWDDIDNAQTITSVNSMTGAVVLDTDDISEGVSNLYYTSARFDSAFSAKDTDDLSEGSLNLYYTSARFDSAFSAKDSDDLSEGSSNLYFTEARVRSAVMTGLTLTSGAFDPADSLIVTLSKAGYQIGDHESRVSALEAKVFVKEQITLSAGDITNGYVNLANQAVANSVVAFIDRLGMHQGSDFSVSVVSGVTRITFKNGSSLIGDGAEAPASGDVMSFTYYK